MVNNNNNNNNNEVYLYDYNNTVLQKRRKHDNYSNLVIRVKYMDTVKLEKKKYIYIYRQVLEVRQWGQLLTGPTRFNDVSAVQPSSDKI